MNDGSLENVSLYNYSSYYLCKYRLLKKREKIFNSLLVTYDGFLAHLS